MPLLFLDLETTGLDPDRCAVLEVGAVVLPDDLGNTPPDAYSFPTFTAVLAYACSPGDNIDPVVLDMHTKNGLWDACRVEFLDTPLERLQHTRHNVDARLREFIIANGAKGAQLAGNSVHFDRAFMRVHLPMSLAELHYRQLDVTSLNELARRVWPAVYETRPRGPEGDASHRALADVYNSIAQARYYATALAPADEREQCAQEELCRLTHHKRAAGCSIPDCHNYVPQVGP